MSRINPLDNDDQYAKSLNLQKSEFEGDDEMLISASGAGATSQDLQMLQNFRSGGTDPSGILTQTI